MSSSQSNTSGIFEPHTESIAEVFTSTRLYKVPDYQRPYSWKGEQIEQLWDDIYSAFEGREETYFLGPTILTREDNGRFIIVDGQQRLTTLTILFCVMRDHFFNTEEGKTIRRINSAIRSDIEDDYRISLRLMNTPHYQNEFQHEILEKVQIVENSKLREKSKFLNTAFIFNEKLEELQETGGYQKIQDFAEYIFEKVVMITITCTSEEYAIRLFEIINTRGLDLSNADLIKRRGETTVFE